MLISNSRQFHISKDLISDDQVTIPISQLYKQMVGVLRLKRGDDVRFFDGIGGVYDGCIMMVGKNGIVVRIDNQSSQPRGKELTLGILKNDRMRWVLEKACELGVSRIVPMISERVVKRPEKVPSRWFSIVKEACEQCGRAWLPELTDVASFSGVVEGGGSIILADVGAVVPFGECVGGDREVLVIGPEGGFTADEVAFVESKGGEVGGLGDYQLRADTACVVAVCSRVGRS